MNAIADIESALVRLKSQLERLEGDRHYWALEQRRLVEEVDRLQRIIAKNTEQFHEALEAHRGMCQHCGGALHPEEKTGGK